MNTCPACQSTERQVKNGRNQSGSQRYRCRACGRTYTLAATRERAVRLYTDGMNLRRIARTLGVVHQTVANWVAAHAATVPQHPPQPTGPVAVAELDELHTFIGHKKTRTAKMAGGSGEWGSGRLRA